MVLSLHLLLGLMMACSLYHFIKSYFQCQTDWFCLLPLKVYALNHDLPVTCQCQGWTLMHDTAYTTLSSIKPTTVINYQCLKGDTDLCSDYLCY